MIELATDNDHAANVANIDVRGALSPERTETLLERLEGIALEANDALSSEPTPPEAAIILHLAAWLIKNGMFPRQAAGTLELMVLGEANNAVSSRWLDPASDYPTALIDILHATCKIYALRYCDEQCPEAWFRPVFLPAEEQAEFLRTGETYRHSEESETANGVERAYQIGDVVTSADTDVYLSVVGSSVLNGSYAYKVVDSSATTGRTELHEHLTLVRPGGDTDVADAIRLTAVFYKNETEAGRQYFGLGDVVLIDGEEHIIDDARLSVDSIQYSTDKSAWHNPEECTLVRRRDEASYPYERKPRLPGR